jgi:hypothetical protein
MRAIQNYIKKLQKMSLSLNLKEGDIIILTIVDDSFKFYRKECFYMSEQKRQNDHLNTIDDLLNDLQRQKQKLYNEIEKKKTIAIKEKQVQELARDIEKAKQQLKIMEEERNLRIMSKEVASGSQVRSDNPPNYYSSDDEYHSPDENGF